MWYRDVCLYFLNQDIYSVSWKSEDSISRQLPFLWPLFGPYMYAVGAVLHMFELAPWRNSDLFGKEKKERRKPGHNWTYVIGPVVIASPVKTISNPVQNTMSTVVRPVYRPISSTWASATSLGARSLSSSFRFLVMVLTESSKVLLITITEVAEMVVVASMELQRRRL